jgi:Cytochrome c2
MKAGFSMRLTASMAGALCIAGVSAIPGEVSASQVYTTRCSMCHRPDGSGVAGQFPRLKGRAGEIAASKEGRSYLIEVVLFGIMGGIDVDGRKIAGMMPPMGSMADQDVADTLNYLVSMAKPKKAVAPFTAAEVKAVRARGKLTAAAVGKERAALAAKGLIP